MAIKNYDTSIDAPVGDNSSGNFLDVKYEAVDDGEYQAEVARVYRWKDITKDTEVAVRDDKNQIVKDASGNPVKEKVPNLKWFMCDIVLRIVSGPNDGKAVKGSLSTHPDMKGALSNFMYASGLYGLPASEVVKHIGARVTVHVKNKTRTYTDKTTGLETSITEPKVSYYEKAKEVADEFEV